jgi:hypothetical protein
VKYDQANKNQITKGTNQSQIYDHKMRAHARGDENFTLSKGAVDDDEQNDIVDLIFQV